MKMINIDYPPKLEVRWSPEKGPQPAIMKICEANRAAQSKFIALMATFEDNFRAIDRTKTDPIEPHWQQSWFLPLDGMSAYTMVAGHRPKRLFEIGSGNSTKFFARAKRDHAVEMELLSIDPHPRAEIDALCDRVHRHTLEDADLTLFDELEAGDVLFFDGSHRAFQNSDVTVLYLDVLPRLAEGVIVGMHDIFWPYDYPEPWLQRYYSEQYMLAAHMLPFGDSFPLIAAAHYMHHHMIDEMRSAFTDGFEELFPEMIAKRFYARFNGFAFWYENTRRNG